MTKKNHLALLLVGVAVSFSLFSCSLEDDVMNLKRQVNELNKQPKASISIPLPEGETSLLFNPRETMSVTISADGVTDIALDSKLPEGWGVKYDEENLKLTVTASAAKGESARIAVSGIDKNGLVYKAILKCRTRTLEELQKIDYSDPRGIFVLNEGMINWNGNGTPSSIIYIQPDHHVVSWAYNMVNGTDLGNISQDMAEYNGNLYVISQNQDKTTDGILTVMEGKTLKKVANYADELSVLDWPTHVAVLDDANIFIRDNKGIYRFDRNTKTLTFVGGTNGARKNTMIIVDGKVISSAGKKILVIEKDKPELSRSITLPGAISGLAPAGADAFYVSYYQKKSGYIAQISVKDFTVTKTNEVSNESAGALNFVFAASSHISAKGDSIYYSGTAPIIYRHIFSTGDTRKMFDARTVNPNHTVTYNTATVSPSTGLVYLNTLVGYGWGKFDYNTFYEIDMTGDEGKLVRRYDNYTQYPAGIFFPFAK